ncbi:MAG: RNA-guided pseudouridylation complex pseudouridine synthase subunit Cbf5 [Nanoarchaeota archaeon]|nr:RNA-guided pseudouridylation complex pseudouridine synthase subunit Cbf5 [Nanoarchaeota archaeon]|tara:strand:- start:828 stop:1742 length:915 start_codon:yes stop_codon:yes gene_type:complete
MKSKIVVLHDVKEQDKPELSTEELMNYGIILVDKPKGPTSHQVSDMVKKALGIGKAGHSGTLDPAVTGLLPVALGRATRIVQFLLKAPKEYIGIMHFHNEIDEQKLRKVVDKFTGKIIQLPPVKSAVKRAKRTREIYELDIIEIKEKDVLFRVNCQAGTYIRKLVHDIGEELDGAHMAELRRTKVGPFSKMMASVQDVKDAKTLSEEGNDKLLRHIILPIERAVELLPKVWILDSAIESVTHGRDVAIPGIVKLNHFNEKETVAIMNMKNELVAAGTAEMHTGNIKRNDKGIAIIVEKVFMTQQ